jgi:hypothetical protein
VSHNKWASASVNRKNSSRGRNRPWGGIQGYDFTGGGASVRRVVGNSRQSNPGRRHPAIKMVRVVRVARAWDAKAECRTATLDAGPHRAFRRVAACRARAGAVGCGWVRSL